MNVLTPAEFAERMKAIFPDDGCYDEEVAHGEADKLMCHVLRSLGYGDGVQRFDDAKKWYA